MSQSDMQIRKQSSALFERAQRVLVGGVNSPVRAFRAVGKEPVFVDRVEGAHVFDVDGRCYIDLVGTWGPAIVGHAHPAVIEAVTNAVRKGLSFGACCESETTLAEIIVDALPSVEMVRFVNSGTEATMSAIRLARAVTERPKILKFLGCYHGHVDALLVAAGSGAATCSTPDSAGVPDAYARLTLLAPYNDLDAVETIMRREGDEVAAILVEPLAGNMGFVKPADGFLPGLRNVCDRHGCLLVFDEVMTGFRVAWGGAQTLGKVRPDLTCLGKVIGGGMPVAAYGGPREFMQRVSPLGPVYQAGTLSGNPVGMAAGVATLTLCKADGFYDALEQKTRRLSIGLKEAAEKQGISVQTGACGGMMGLAFSNRPVRNFADAQACDHRAFKQFFASMLEGGVWLPPSGYEAMFVSAAHEDHDIDGILAAASVSFGKLRA